MTVKLVKLTTLSLLVALTAACGEFTRQGRSPVLVQVIDLETDDGGTLLSDVVTMVTSPAPCTTTSPCPTVFNDMAEVELGLILKDPGAPGIPAAPTELNSVTITRYRVEYRRSDGRNTQGVDVPYAFDSAFTLSIPPSGTAEASFELVRHTAKDEAPLRALASNGDLISTIATVTFYGHDQAGNDVMATASVGVNFGNFADDNN